MVAGYPGLMKLGILQSGLPNSNVLLTMQNAHFSALRVVFLYHIWQTGIRRGYSRALKMQMFTCSIV